MKKNLFLYLAAVVSCLLSCSDQADIHLGSKEGVKISLRSSTLDASLSSRSPFGGALSSDNPLTALVPSAVAIDNAKSGYVDGLHALGTMTFNGGSGATFYDKTSLGDNAESKAAFPASNQVYLFGLYPSNADLWSFTNTSASMTFTGKEDVMAAPELLAKGSDVESGDYQQLAFSHLLTRLEVKFKAKDADAIASVGSIKSIRLVADASGSGKVKNHVTYTPETGTAVFTESETATALPFYGANVSDGKTVYTDTPYESQSYELTTSPVLQAYALVAPVVADEANENEYFLAIERVDGDVDYVGFDLLQSDNSTLFVGSTAGYSFSVVLTYSQEYIETVQAVVSGTIGSQDWKDNGSAIETN